MSTQSLRAVQSGGYTYLYDESTGQAYKLSGLEPVSIFENNQNLPVGDDSSFSTSPSSGDYICTDGKDDGKLTFGDACVSAFKGIAKMVVSPVTEALKGNFVPALTAIAGTAAVTLLGPIGIIGTSAVGLIAGGAQLVKGVSNAMNAETDGEAKQAFEEIGQGGFAALTSLLGLKGGTKQIKNMKNDTSTHLGRLYEEKGSKAPFNEKAAAYFKDTKLGKLFFKDDKEHAPSPVEDISDDDTTLIEESDDGLLADRDDIPPVTDGDDLLSPTDDGTPAATDIGEGTPAPTGTPTGAGDGVSAATGAGDDTLDIGKGDGTTAPTGTPTGAGDVVPDKDIFHPEGGSHEAGGGAKTPSALEGEASAAKAMNIADIETKLYETGVIDYTDRYMYSDDQLVALYNKTFDTSSGTVKLAANTSVPHDGIKLFEGEDGQMAFLEDVQSAPPKTETGLNEQISLSNNEQIEGQMSIFDISKTPAEPKCKPLNIGELKHYTAEEAAQINAKTSSIPPANQETMKNILIEAAYKQGYVSITDKQGTLTTINIPKIIQQQTGIALPEAGIPISRAAHNMLYKAMCQSYTDGSISYQELGTALTWVKNNYRFTA